MPLFICQGCGAETQEWNGKCPFCPSSETIRLAQSTDRMIDRVIKGKFKIVRKLGQGGMGAVYLAEQVGIGHRVAVKFLKSEFSNDPEIAKRFINEAKIFGRVAHPNAVSLNEFGQDEEGNLYIAMEYCEGVDLKKVIAEQGRLPLIESIDVVLQVADVLVNAHANGVVHRDLKPENIMIRRGIRGMHAKVLDFGIARLMDASTKLTVAGAIAGTPRYMSPEQVAGGEADHRADIYSLGIVLFELLTGRQPFDGNTIAEILRKQSVEPLPHLTELAPDLDYPDLDAVLQRACAKKREERWPDMLSFASALSQAVPTQAHLGMSPLQRSSVHLAIVTPVPGAYTEGEQTNATPFGRSGVALPGAPAEEADSRTLVKTGLTPSVARPGGATASTQLDGAQVGGSSLVVPTSKAPLFTVLAMVVVATVVAAVMFWPQPGELQKPAQTTEPVKPSDPNPVKPSDPVKPDDGAAAVVRDVARAELNASNYSRGQAEFEAASFENAETFLSRIPAGSELAPRAAELLGKITAIRETLASALASVASGDCEAAKPKFQKVLKLNARVREAAVGLQRCRDADISPTMP